MKAGCKKEIYINGEVFCESCTPDENMILQHISIFDGQTSWCLWCASMEEMISDEEHKMLQLENLILREAYLNRELEECKSKLIKGNTTGEIIS